MTGFRPNPLEKVRNLGYNVLSGYDMNRFNPMLVVALLFGTLTFSSCVLPLGAPAGGLSVHVKFPRQLSAASGFTLADLASWEVVGSGPAGAVLQADYTKTTTQADVTGLVPGEWAITVNAMDATRERILTGSTVVTLVAGQPNVVDIALKNANSVVVTVNFADPQQPVLAINRTTNNVSVNSESNLVVFDSSSASLLSLKVTTEFDSYAWYLNNVETPVCSVAECVLSGPGQVELPAGTSTFLLVVGKGGQYYSQQFWVTDVYVPTETLGIKG